MIDYSTLNKSLDCWRSFVEECEDGYDWDVSEYNNEVRERSKLEVLLINPSSLPIDGSIIEEMCASLKELDERLQRLFIKDFELPDKAKWWEKGVLSKAGSPYCEYMKVAHGLEVELVQ